MPGKSIGQPDEGMLITRSQTKKPDAFLYRCTRLKPFGRFFLHTLFCLASCVLCLESYFSNLHLSGNNFCR
ncbi:hypothetical protein C943_03292 [Mariniradius saccharolyticus AK6]|uniref:Uncharacterized protein n=1 Tax=Mariniradius saccharolyticus AK6 TaxID=1239962 RepID=M7XAZ4_9BACT|nr:hypothetical protein C943_03292 [Mariniradius saccharolyticus AK6]